MDCLKISSVPSLQLATRIGSSVSPSQQGSLHLTKYHLIFRPSSSSSSTASTSATPTQSEIWLPIPLIHSITRHPPNLTGSAWPITLRTWNFQTYDLVFEKEDELDKVWESIKGLAASVASGVGDGEGRAGVEGLYAFSKGPGKGRGWDVYNPKEEFLRMGVGTRTGNWRFTDINKNYEFCPTYPALLCVPTKISDSTLSYAVKYRSKGRIPGLVYLHWANLGSITRSSQPMVGIKNARSIQDEKLIEAVFASHSQHTRAPVLSSSPFKLSSSPASPSAEPAVYGSQSLNLIIDARPTANAYANSVKGAGTENLEYYKGCKKSYLGIDNIHVMRSSLQGVFDALRESETTGHLDRTSLRKTSWLKHTSSILEGTLIITRTIHLTSSHVLVHCSDGWDRTSQLSSLAQLCLDPYYRTAKGFAVLIEKDWMSFGHKFCDRNGFLVGDRLGVEVVGGGDEGTGERWLESVKKGVGLGQSHKFKETCPVFLQFLDCVWQIWRQGDGERFEFGEEFLKGLVKEAYEGETGSFLFNDERERIELSAKRRTTSVWDRFFDGEGAEWKLKEEWRNEAYTPELDKRDSRDGDQGVLLIDSTDVRWWFGLFGRKDEEMNGRAVEDFQQGLGAGTDEDGVVVVPRSVGEDDSGLNSPVLVEQPSSSSVNPSAISTSTTSSAINDPLSSTNQPSSSSAPNSFSVPGAGVSVNLLTQVQLTAAASAVQKFGWGAWKAAQKGYQEAVTSYRDASTSSPSTSLSSSPAPNTFERTSSATSLPTLTTSNAGGGPSGLEKGGVYHSRVVDGESSGSSWRADDGEELGSGIRGGGGGTPLRTPTLTTSTIRPPRPAVSSRPNSPLPPSPQPKRTSTPPNPPSPAPSQPSQPPSQQTFHSAPLPPPVTSFAAHSPIPSPKATVTVLPPNPWDAPAPATKSSSPAGSIYGGRTKAREKMVEEPVDAGGGDTDPLGVGFN